MQLARNTQNLGGGNGSQANPVLGRPAGPSGGKFPSGQQYFEKTTTDLLSQPKPSGNPARTFNFLTDPESRQDLETTLSSMFMRTSWYGHSILGRLLLPAIPVPSGMRNFNMQRYNYNIEPTSPLPELGVPRLMSMNQEEVEFTIATEGIAGRVSEKQFQNDKGLNIFKMHIENFTYSTELRQELMRYGRLVNAADNTSTMQKSALSNVQRHRQLYARDLEVFASNGSSIKDINILLTNLLQRHSNADVIVVSGKAAAHFALNQSQYYPIPMLQPQYATDGMLEELLEYEKDDLQIKSIGQIGALPVFPGSIFHKSANTTGFDPLESIATIGEVYNDRTDRDYRSPVNHPYSPEHDSVVIYDEPNDEMRELRFADGLKYAHIWDASSKTGGYHRLLQKYVQDLQTNKIAPDSPEPEMPVVYPVSHDGTQYFLPHYVGTFDNTRLPESLLFEMLEANSAGFAGPSSNNISFSDFESQIREVESLRQSIESLPPDSKSLEAIARANIARSVVKTETGEPKFHGSITPPEIFQQEKEYKFRPLNEWAGEPEGGLTLPDGAEPIGYWSAAGLSAIAKSSHPFKQQAASALEFLSSVANKFEETFENSAVLHNLAQPPNIHSPSNVQQIMTAVWGARAPLMLAAPRKLVLSLADNIEAQPASAETSIQFNGQRLKVVANTADGGRLLQPTEENTAYFETADGVLYSANVSAAEVPPNSPIMAQISELDWLTNNDLNSKDKTVIQSTLAKILRKKTGVENYVRALVAAVFLRKNNVSAADSVQAVFEPNDADARQKISEYANKDLRGYEQEVNKTVNLIRASTYASLPPQRKEIVDDQVKLAKTVKEAAEKFVTQLKEVGQLPANPNGYFASNNLNQFGDRTNLLSAIIPDDAPGVDGLKLSQGILRTAVTRLEGYGDFLGVRVMPFLGDRAADDGRIDSRDLYNARMFRAPLNATHRIVEDIRAHGRNWVTVANPKDSFNTELPLENFDVLNNYGLLDVSASRNLYDYARSYNKTAGKSVFVLTEIALGDRDKKLLEQGDGPMVNRFMEERLRLIRHMSRNNWIKLLVGIGTLLLHHNNLGAVESAVRRGMLLPMKPLYFRPVSRHNMGDMLVMKRGQDTGFVPYTDGHINVALDDTRRDMIIRAEITTGALVTNEDNITFLGPSVPLGYIGGHNSKFVRSEKDIMAAELSVMQSVFFTLIGRHELKERAYPISFVNDVPGAVDISQYTKPRDAIPQLQYFSGGQYYGQYVYPNFFSPDNRRTYESFDVDKNGRESFYRRGNFNEHLCWGGFYVEWDPRTRSYSNKKRGNGHRPDFQMNSPGAYNYWNGTRASVNPVVSSSTQLGDTLSYT